MKQLRHGRMHAGPVAPIWRSTGKQRLIIVKKVCGILEKSFGNPRLGNPDDPVDDLIYLIISNRTQAVTARSVYDRLRTAGNWDEIAQMPRQRIARLIRRAGFAEVRSSQIKGALLAVRNRFGIASLEALRNWPEATAHEFLTSLPGVSDKVAKCVMMYTLGFKVLPVDVHVFRVSTRLGWTTRCRASEAHFDLEAIVKPALRYGFHVNCIALGREFCRQTEPKCAACPISKYCIHFKKPCPKAAVQKS